MSVKLFIRNILLFSILFAGSIVSAQNSDFPKRPVPPRIVNDFAGVLSRSERNALENKLVAFNDSTSTQIAVVTIKSLKDYDAWDYATRLLDLWGVGQKGKDNGIVILIKPKTGNEKGQVAISVGYGLEAVVPDAAAKMIVENEMIPAFREENYYKGINNAANVLFRLTRSEFTADDYVKARRDSTDGGDGFLTVLFIIGIILIIAFFSGRKGRRRGIRTNSFPWWMAGGMGGFGGGRSSGGGGGFGGFGGGRGGGGGASGSW